MSRERLAKQDARVRIPVRVSGALKARRNPQLIYIVAQCAVCMFTL